MSESLVQFHMRQRDSTDNISNIPSRDLTQDIKQNGSCTRVIALCRPSSPQKWFEWGKNSRTPQPPSQCQSCEPRQQCFLLVHCWARDATSVKTPCASGDAAKTPPPLPFAIVHNYNVCPYAVPSLLLTSFLRFCAAHYTRLYAVTVLRADEALVYRLWISSLKSPRRRTSTMTSN